MQEGQAVLRNRHARPVQAARAALEELAREQHRRRSDRLGGIDDDCVETLRRFRHIAHAAGDDQFGARIVESALADAGQMLLADIDDGAIDLAQHHALDAFVLQHRAPEDKDDLSHAAKTAIG